MRRGSGVGSPGALHTRLNCGSVHDRYTENGTVSVSVTVVTWLVCPCLASGVRACMLSPCVVFMCGRAPHAARPRTSRVPGVSREKSRAATRSSERHRWKTDARQMAGPAHRAPAARPSSVGPQCHGVVHSITRITRDSSLRRARVLWWKGFYRNEISLPRLFATLRAKRGYRSRSLWWPHGTRSWMGSRTRSSSVTP